MTLPMRHGEWEESKERERGRGDVRRGDVALPSNCKANFKTSVTQNKIRIRVDEVNKARKHSSWQRSETELRIYQFGES